MPLDKDPPAEVLEYWQGKRLTPSFDYRDVWLDEHATEFTVAKSAGFDILGDIQAALDDVILSGQTFAHFKKNLTPILQAKGWWGIKTVVDPATGEEVEVQLGSPRRLKTIYDANLRTAYAAGQWQRIQQSIETHPYLVYELGPSKEHRLEHERWEGFIASATDAWWDTHYPPNGWGCKCRVRQVSKREAARLIDKAGFTDYRDTPVPAGVTVGWMNKRTGEVEQIPAGIDPGWNNNPGKARFGRALKRWADRQAASGVPYPNRIEVLPGGAKLAESVRSALQKMPPAAWLLLEAQGVRVEVAESLVSADPALFASSLPRGHEGRGWEHVDGVTAPGRIIVGAQVATGDGATRVSSPKRAAVVLAHEIGHAIDQTLQISESMVAERAWTADIARLLTLPDHQQQPLGYFLQPYPAGTQEALAELWRQWLIPNPEGDLDIHKAFPQLSALFKQQLIEAGLWVSAD